MADTIFPGRFTAQNSQELVLFRIGMRFNSWRGILSALRTFGSMPPMLAEQLTNRETGMLSTTTSLSWPVIHLTQFWRSFEDLERYATAPDGRHTRVWRMFNNLGRRGHGTGIWHETYRIAPGTYEAIYVNMPRYGLAAATNHESVVSAKARARDRLGVSSAKTSDERGGR